MKKITIKILTDKGEEAYKQISNIKQSWKEKAITDKAFKQEIIQRDPTIIIINCKIPWLADKTQMDQQIILAMSKYGCDRDLDYTLEVEQ